MIIVCDDHLPTTHQDYIRVFLLPSKVWKQHWKKDSASMGFIQDKWYSKYRLAI
jgi:hypothetical protein